MNRKDHADTRQTPGIPPCLSSRCIRAFATPLFLGALALTASGEGPILANLSFEELGQVKVISATLTPTETRLIPAKTTTITSDVIQQSGARTLNELLEICTTNTQIILHNGHLEHFGIRGIISDRDDKYLLRVNGRVMNQRLFIGAESERGLPLLGDLDEVTLVLGPASATYGPGALAGALNLRTYNGLTFEGSDLAVRQGAWDEFTSGEVRFGQRFSEQSGLFLYCGIASCPGAAQSSSPYVVGSSLVTPGDAPDVTAGEPVDLPLVALRDSGGVVQKKFHASLVMGPLEIWARYTLGSGWVRPMRATLPVLDATTFRGRWNKDTQYTVTADWKRDLSPAFNLEAMVSYDSYEHIYWHTDIEPDPLVRQDKELYSKVLGTWTANGNNTLALGVECSHSWFDGSPLNTPVAYDSWSADTFSVLAEHQWRPVEHWTTFLSCRVDKHTYTDWIPSPRLAVSFAPDDRNTFKLITAHAVRSNNDAELRREHTVTGTRADTETLDSIELRVEHQQGEHLKFELGVFVERDRAIGYDIAADRTLALGTFWIWGLEPELTWVDGGTRFSLSHSFTQLEDAELDRPGTIQGISADPYGFGHNLANWANHVTKLSLIREIGERWTASTSLRCYWGFPGAEDLALWNATQTPPRNLALADPGYDKAFGPAIYWSAGLEFRPVEGMTIRVDAHNILGWADRDLNKRIYYQRGSDYSCEAAALSFTLRQRF